MRPAPKPGFLSVARRECQWLLHDRVALLLIFGVPLFAFVVLTIVFSHPVIRGLGVTVVLPPEKIAACLVGLGRQPAAGTR